MGQSYASFDRPPNRFLSGDNPVSGCSNTTANRKQRLVVSPFCYSIRELAVALDFRLLQMACTRQNQNVPMKTIRGAERGLLKFDMLVGG